MRKLGILSCLLFAILLPQVWPNYKDYLNRGFNKIRPVILDGMMYLIDVNSHLMEPLINLFRLKTADLNDKDGDDTEPFKLPQCLKQPIALEKLEKYKHLSILGVVFDVSSNRQLYGPDGIYALLTGRDATRMIISDGMKDAESDIFALDALTSSQLNELGDWLKIYIRKYRCIGYLPGVYWSPMGDPSELLVNLVEAWNKQPPENIDFDELLPPCNSFFDGKKLRLSCNLYNSDSSEHFYPRQLLEPEKAKMRCACVPKSHLTHSRLRLYPGCSDIADQCLISIANAESIWTGGMASFDII
ncbi:unnamed protein product [Hymenolepis diminuta]|uniref:Cytochrome b5 heme-binding domain-containing protein n=1 Tax=Hymenolepis diminuta TaxID=6216 RepID=A0A0R3S7K5_HYMDI|nr:unnamed protein product [Hymenolepis diminuta]VUZ47129.1 unnamed protein product [Hymenolepis diminuta]